LRRLLAAGLGALLLTACGLLDDPDATERFPRAERIAPDVVMEPEEPFRFAVIGDFGTGTERQQEVADRMCRRHSSHPFEVVFTTGDNIYPDGDPALFEPRFHDVYRCLFDRGVSFHAALGNHDVLTNGGRHQLNDPAFGMPAFNYVVRVAGIRFVIADSERLDRDWLRRKVYGAGRARATVVVMHHPVFSAGTGHGSTPGFEDLHRMFRRAGVDLVLHGHDHVYTSTKKLRGVRYVVTGGGGADLGGCRPTDQTAICSARHHFLYGKVTGDGLVVEAIPRRGRPFHRFRVPLAPGGAA
jgi:hypothetical protein